jgi:hypothetical protein
MAKISHLNEFIEHELASQGFPSRSNEYSYRKAPSRISVVRAVLDDSAIWKAALELACDYDRQPAGKSQSD